MSELNFERGRHGLKVRRTFIRSGVSGKGGDNLSEKQIAKLADDDIEVLVKQEVLVPTDGRGEVSADSVSVSDAAGSDEADAKGKKGKK